MSIFGTDGVRGRAGHGLLAVAGARAIGRAFAGVLPGSPLVAVARDTRESGAWLMDAVVGGLLEGGASVQDLGVFPTPALSWWVGRQPQVSAGVMVTASHNPWTDNGIKLLGPDGRKAQDSLQDACEAAIAAAGALEADAAARGGGGTQGDPCTAGDVAGAGSGPPPGRLSDRAGQARAEWVASLLAGRQGCLEGRLVVADDAAGAAWQILAPVLEACGAAVLRAAPEPDGRNINDGVGAVHPEAAARLVAERGAWGGVVLDGDGDRVQLVDEAGRVHDGDAILGFLAERMAADGTLRGGAVTGTITTNGGLESFLRDRGIGLIRAEVGDRHVASAMDACGCNLGGEYSGHVLTPDLCPTGDGIRVALLVLGAAAAMGAPLSALLGGVPHFPSSYRKVPESGPRLPAGRIAEHPAVAAIALEVERGGGRTLIRWSGTEPLLRVQVEGPSPDLVEAWADRLADAAGAALAAGPAGAPGGPDAS